MTYRDTESALRAKIESLEAENARLLKMTNAYGSIFDPESAVYWKDRAAKMERLYLAEKSRKNRKHRPLTMKALKDWFTSNHS